MLQGFDTLFWLDLKKLALKKSVPNQSVFRGLGLKKTIWFCGLWLALMQVATSNPVVALGQGASAQAQTVFPEPSDTPQPLPALPPAEQLLELPPVSPILPDAGSAGEPSELMLENVPDTIVVTGFDIVGSTVFSQEELAEIAAPYTGRPIAVDDLFELRSAITQYYQARNYIGSGAYIPPQTLTDGVVQIQVVEGRLESIDVEGSGRLNPNYIRSRLAVAGAAPLNSERLLEGLRLLQLDPLVESISAELSAGVEPGTSVLAVDVKVADTLALTLVTNNTRSPSVGSWRRGATLTEANLLGLGDSLSVNYLNTEGSNEVGVAYELPLNARNGTLGVRASFTDSAVIEDPFNFLDIQSDAQDYAVSFRQPLWQTPTQSFAVGVSLSHKRSRTEFLESLIGEAIGFPSPGADAQGRTRLSALRFSQEWTSQGSREVFALFSEFSLGLGLLDATINPDNIPDSQFLSWRAQGQWVRLLAPETLLLLRGDVQLSGDTLLPLEQFGLGGQQTVRGYRQDVLLSDNGLALSAEVRLPVYRAPEVDGLLQVTPFVDLGTVWNSGTPNPDPATLASIGLGLLWQQGDRLTARLDWGIPLIGIDKRSNTWQENGIYFSIQYTPF
jgi:hemolysin activation/secretion protein